MAETTQRNEHQLLIGGKWVDASDGTYEIINPATEEIVGLAPNASADDAQAAAAAAKEAQPAWAELGVRGRAAVLDRLRSWLAHNSPRVIETLVEETGKTFEDAQTLELARVHRVCECGEGAAPARELGIEH